MKSTILILLASLICQQISAQCLDAFTINVDPPLDTLEDIGPGTLTTITFEVTSYTQLDGNMFHGLTYQMGEQFDKSTLTATITPTTCDGLGNWQWYNTATGTYSGIKAGPGFFYNSPLGDPGGVLDGNPDDSYGDNCTVPAAGVWLFEVTVMYTGGKDPGIQLHVHADGETGGRNSISCIQDPTLNYGSICPQPTSLLSQILNPTKVYLSWDLIPAAYGYRLKGRRAGSTNVQTRSVPFNEVTINGVTPGKTYIWQVRAACGFDTTNLSHESTFTMPTLKVTAESTGESPVNGNAISLYPNPVTDFANIRVHNWPDSEAVLRIVDLAGREMVFRELDQMADTKLLYLDLNSLDAGAYILELRSQTHSERLHLIKAE